MDNAGVLNFNRADLSEGEGEGEDSSCSASDTPVKPRLGRFIDVYSPEHLNLTPKPKTKLLFNQIRNEGPITVTPEKYYDSDNEYKCRTVKGERRFRRVYEECSFEGNQSFPRVRRRAANMDVVEPHAALRSTVDLVRVDGPNGLRFNSVLCGASGGGGGGEAALGGGSPASSVVGGAGGGAGGGGMQPHCNTGKAVFTIEPHSSKILIVNSAACSLLGYSAGELSGVRFAELVRGGGGALVERGAARGGGGPAAAAAVLLSGKVVELLRKEGGSVQVSLWVRQLEPEGPRLVVAEPVTARTVVLTVEAESGVVRACAGDEDAPAVFGADCADRLLGLPVTQLIPSIRLPPATPAAAGDAPDTLSKQKATGRTLDGGCFPLCLWISRPTSTWHGKVKDNVKEIVLLDVNVRVTYNVSGLLVVDESGVVSACNHHFAQLTFGKHHHEVVGRRIDTLIQNFCRDTDVLRLDLELDPDPELDLDPDHATRDNTDMTLSPLDNRTRDRESASESEEGESGGALDGVSQRSACTSLNVQPSLTQTATQDMVSSLSTSQRLVSGLVSGLSAVSVSDATFPPTISKSRSESVLRRERARAAGAGAGGSDSVYYSSQPRVAGLAPLDLDPPGSDETSADFLTPINEMPPPPPELELDLDPLEGADLDPLGDSLDTDSAGRHVALEAGATSTPSRGGAGGAAAGGGGGGGTYRGTVVHKDGTELPVVYTVSTMQTAGGARVRCVWLGVALEGAPRHATRASTSTPDDSSLILGTGAAGAGTTGNKSAASSRASRPHSMSLASQADRDEQQAGEYSKHYVTLKQIGKGAFGCVKMAYRRSDRLLAVTKFILKEKVGAQFWVDAPPAVSLSLTATTSDGGRRLPLELSLLLTLKHTNIVSVIDVFENDKYFQMVMEKHGAGMDLFEFIERRPKVDEPLLSYIFRQICEAVAYLHSLNILHRDIKDENVIIDDRFHVKLIDFGSAAFRATDTFGTFYGTTEYCSPEVLAGNRYAGPELEVWAMGVTLYVLAFSAAPFADIEDTVRGVLVLPPSPPARRASPALEAVLRAALARDPAARITVSQLVRHPWITQPVAIERYSFPEVVECTPSEAAPETHYAGPTTATPTTTTRRSRHVEDSLRSSADILDLSSKPVSGGGEGEVTSLSEDATGHAAADIDIDLDLEHEDHLEVDPDPELDSWDECEQDSFS